MELPGRRIRLENGRAKGECVCVAAGLAEGLSIIQMSRVYKVGQATIRAMRDREGSTVAEQKKGIAAKLRSFARAAADRLLDEVDNIPLQSLPIALGITIEKAQLLEGEATSRIEHVGVPKHDDLNSYLDALPQADGRVVEETHCAAVPGGQKALPAPAAPDPILAGLEPGAAVPAEARERRT